MPNTPPGEAPERARGMLAFYVATGTAFLLLAGGFTAWLLHRTRDRELARRWACAAHLREICLGCHLYADDNNEVFPPSLEAMVPNYIDAPYIFVCVSAKSAGLPRPHYVYVPGLRPTHPGDTIMIFEPLRNHDSRGLHVAFADAHVEWWPADRAEEFRAKLANQQEIIRRWREAGARAEDIPKFFKSEPEGAPK